MMDAETLEAELKSLLEREKKLKQIRTVQIRVERLEAKMSRISVGSSAVFKIIGERVEKEFGIKWSDIMAKTKIHKICEARQIVCYLARTFGCHLVDAGRQMRIDHGTVHHAYHKISDLMSIDEKFKARITALEISCRAELERRGLIEKTMK
jgi:chromosomal replication initiation ATPase DnaA